MNDTGSVFSLEDTQNSRVSTGTGTLIGSLSSQSTQIRAPIQPGSNAFRSAVLRFRARLSGDKLTDFKNTTHEELVHEIMRIQQEQENNKNMINLSRIQSFLEAMDQFGKTIEVFLNVSDAVAFVWGPIKFLLLVQSIPETRCVWNQVADAFQTASNFTDSFEMLLDAYEQIGEHLPLLQEYEALFHHSPHMVQSLELMYMDILEFHQDAMRFFSGKRK